MLFVSLEIIKAATIKLPTNKIIILKQTRLWVHYSSHLAVNRNIKVIFTVLLLMNMVNIISCILVYRMGSFWAHEMWWRSMKEKESSNYR